MKIMSESLQLPASYTHDKNSSSDVFDSILEKEQMSKNTRDDFQGSNQSSTSKAQTSENHDTSTSEDTSQKTVSEETSSNSDSQKDDQKKENISQSNAQSSSESSAEINAHSHALNGSHFQQDFEASEQDILSENSDLNFQKTDQIQNTLEADESMQDNTIAAQASGEFVFTNEALVQKKTTNDQQTQMLNLVPSESETMQQSISLDIPTLEDSSSELTSVDTDQRLSQDNILPHQSTDANDLANSEDGTLETLQDVVHFVQSNTNLQTSSSLNGSSMKDQVSKQRGELASAASNALSSGEENIQTADSILIDGENSSQFKVDHLKSEAESLQTQLKEQLKTAQIQSDLSHSHALAKNQGLEHMEASGNIALNTSPGSLTEQQKLQSTEAPQLLSISRNVQDPQWTEKVFERVEWMLKSDVSAAEIRIDPPDLGPIKVSLNVKNDQASVVFTSPSLQVKELIELNMDRLKDALSQEGFTFVDVSSEQSFQQNSEHNQDESLENSPIESPTDEPMQHNSIIEAHTLAKSGIDCYI